MGEIHHLPRPRTIWDEDGTVAFVTAHSDVQKILDGWGLELPPEEPEPRPSIAAAACGAILIGLLFIGALAVLWGAFDFMISALDLWAPGSNKP